MTQSNICIRLDENLKRQFDYLCNEFGLTMTTAINMFVRAVVRENRIPFEISVDLPNAKTRQAIEDINNGKFYSIPYKSGKKVTDFILEDDDAD